MRRFRSGLLALLVVGLLVLAVRALAPPPVVPESLRARAASADRVLIKTGATIERTEYERPPLSIVGESQARELLDLIDFVPPPPGYITRCGCDGDYHIEFYRGDQLLLSLGYHHNTNLRWRHSRWNTDVELTEQAKQAVPAWFARQGYDSMQAHYAEGPR